VIPAIRGAQRSRPVDDIVREVRSLADAGVKELNLIAQDTAAYGRDLNLKKTPVTKRVSLADLVEQCADVAGIHWVRLLYLYPDLPDDELISLLADHPRVVPYVDMPMQHATDDMLRRMRRGHGADRIRSIVEKLRHRIPDLTFRSAFIVGHPGETQADFDRLCDLVRWAKFEHLGVFRYSDEEGTGSYDLPDKISPLVAANRYRRLMAIARRLSRAHNEQLTGQQLEVLVEGVSDQHELVQMGRHQGQAPEIDGQVYLSRTERLAEPLQAGQLVRVRITQASDYDLVGDVSEP